MAPNARSGVYKIHIPNNGPVDLFCDMTTDSGGWTLVWSYTFTLYNSFRDPRNAVTPIPNWPVIGTNVPSSTSPPSSEYSPGALDFKQWKFIGREFLIKSNINHWISCRPGKGSLVDWKAGNIHCRNVKNIAPAPACQETAPNKIVIFSQVPVIATTGKSWYFYFDGRTNFDNPIHDPCSSNQENQKKGVISPGGNIFVR